MNIIYQYTKSIFDRYRTKCEPCRKLWACYGKKEISGNILIPLGYGEELSHLKGAYMHSNSSFWCKYC
jgi:hypothetical protein